MAQNYALGSNIAQGIREGMTEYGTFKNQQRQKDMLDFAQKSNGIVRGEDGILQYTPEAQARHEAKINLDDQQVKSAQEAFDPLSQSSQAGMGLLRKGFGYEGPDVSAHDQQGILGGYEKKGAIDSAQELARARMAATQGQQGNRMDLMAQRLHGQNMKDVSNDAMTNKLITTSQNLDNAIRNFKQGGATPQEFNELQQAVRSNVGVSGTSGVDERGETYLKSMGINKDKFLQFLTGDPQSVISSDPKFAEQILKVANLEKENKAGQARQQIMKKAAGHKSFYDAHPDMKADFDEGIKQQLGQFGGDQAQQGAPASGPGGAMSFEQFMANKKKTAGQ